MLVFTTGTEKEIRRIKGFVYKQCVFEQIFHRHGRYARAVPRFHLRYFVHRAEKIKPMRTDKRPSLLTAYNDHSMTYQLRTTALDRKKDRCIAENKIQPFDIMCLTRRDDMDKALL